MTEAARGALNPLCPWISAPPVRSLVCTSHQVIPHDALPSADRCFSTPPAHADYPHRVRCLSQRYMAAAQAETGSVLMRQVVVVVVALTAFLLVTVARSSRWPFGRENLQDSTAAVALFFGNVPLCPAASADCFLVSESRRCNHLS